MFGALRNCALAVLLLAAVPASTAVAAPDPTSYKVMHPAEPPIPDGQGRIYLYREAGFVGGAVQPTILIGGANTGLRSRPADYSYIDRPAGTYKISTVMESEESTSVTVVAGQPVYVKFTVDFGVLAGVVVPAVIDPAIAQDEIKHCYWRAPKPVEP